MRTDQQSEIWQANGRMFKDFPLELPETCRVSCRSKFGKLVHLVGFLKRSFGEYCCLSGKASPRNTSGHYIGDG